MDKKPDLPDLDIVRRLLDERKNIASQKLQIVRVETKSRLDWFNGRVAAWADGAVDTIQDSIEKKIYHDK